MQRVIPLPENDKHLFPVKESAALLEVVEISNQVGSHRIVCEDFRSVGGRGF
jgi:hypothetical protein